MKKNISEISRWVAVVYPSTGSFPSNFGDFVTNALIPPLTGLIVLVFSIGLLVFIWGLAKMILHADDEKELAKGKSLMIWGIVSLFVMASIFGILQFLYGQFNFSGPHGFGIPQLPQ